MFIIVVVIDHYNSQESTISISALYLLCLNKLPKTNEKLDLYVGNHMGLSAIWKQMSWQ